MKKKILFLPWTYSMGGGSERVLSEILRRLDYNKYEVDVMECAHYDNGNEAYFKAVNWLNCLWDYTKKSKIASHFLLLKYWIATLFPQLFKNSLPSKQYDVAVAFNYQIPSFFLPFVNAKRRVTWVHFQIDNIDYQSVTGGGKINNFLNIGLRRKLFQKLMKL